MTLQKLNSEEREESLRRYFKAAKEGDNQQATQYLNSDQQDNLVEQLISFLDLKGDDKDYGWTVSKFSQVLSDFLIWWIIPYRH